MKKWLRITLSLLLICWIAGIIVFSNRNIKIDIKTDIDTIWNEKFHSLGLDTLDLLAPNILSIGQMRISNSESLTPEERVDIFNELSERCQKAKDNAEKIRKQKIEQKFHSLGLDTLDPLDNKTDSIGRKRINDSSLNYKEWDDMQSRLFDYIRDAKSKLESKLNKKYHSLGIDKLDLLYSKDMAKANALILGDNSLTAKERTLIFKKLLDQKIDQAFDELGLKFVDDIMIGNMRIHNCDKLNDHEKGKLSERLYLQWWFKKNNYID